MFRWPLAPFLLFCLFLNVSVQSADSVYIPESLQPWKEWVLHDHPDVACPYRFNSEQKACEWTAELRLDLHSRGGEFTLRGEMFRDGWLTLPGRAQTWPIDVVVNGQPVVVLDKQNIPKAFLAKGAFNLKGAFNWSVLPRSLQIPEDAGLTSLTLNQQTITQPVFQSPSEVSLFAETVVRKTQQDSLDIKVFRLLRDSNPALIETRIQLDVGGQEREVVTGPLLFPGFTLQSLISDLPARLESNGKIRFQLRPGRWQATAVMRLNEPFTSLSITQQDVFWPTQEIWSFQASPLLRYVRLAGMPSVDPKQTQLPGEWQNLPSYLAEPGQRLTFEEQYRGNPSGSSEKLSLNKTLWLDFSGEFFTVRDQLRGDFQHSRLEVESTYDLQRAEQGMDPLLVTTLSSSSNPGIEVRQKDLQLMAVSRVASNNEQYISGWQVNFERISHTLILPPGWSLFYASGADYVSQSWVSRWNLWHIFLFLLISVALGRAFSWKVGVLACATLLLTYHRPGALLLLWINFAAIYALRAFVKGRLQVWWTRYSAASIIVCLVALLPFMVEQIRLAVYPQLEQSRVESYGSSGYAREQAYQDQVTDELAPMAESDGMVSRPRLESISTLSRSKVSEKQRSYQTYDSGQKIQVGPGIPEWEWNTYNINWGGPVTQGEKHQVVLVSPFWNRLGYLFAPLMQLGLLLVISMYLFGDVFKAYSLKPAKNLLGLVFLACAGLVLSGMPNSAQAQVVVDTELLKSLEARLLAKPRCLPHCASLESVSLQLDEARLKVTMVWNSAESMAIPLPARIDSWMPSEVKLNGVKANSLHTHQGQLHFLASPGRNTVEISGTLTGRDQLNLMFLDDLRNVSVTADGWRVQGLPNQRQASQTLVLQREEKSKEENVRRLTPDPVAPYVSVTRELRLGLEWRIETTVRRVAPSTGAIHLSVPLIPGEKPVDAKANADGNVIVAFAENQSVVRWDSNLETVDQLILKAPEQAQWNEIWLLDVDYRWHADVFGIPARGDTGITGSWVWLPWPGEQVTIDLEKPKAVIGRDVGVDSISLTHHVGKRSNDNRLEMTIRSNQGAYFPLPLPENAEVNHVAVNGTDLPVTVNNQVLSIPIGPGKHSVSVHWSQNDSVSWQSATPHLDLGTPASNIRLNIQLPSDRWLWFVSGPAVGPAVLFWGIFGIVLVIAFILGRTRFTPLNPFNWILLSIGVVTINLYLLILIAAWFIVIHVRGEKKSAPVSRSFNVLQMLLFLFSVVALGSLLSSIPVSLLSNPNMMIAGNGSYSSSLQWYHDQSDGVLPKAVAYSLPILYYRIAMLIWSIWLAFALMRWIPWAWKQLGVQGFWYFAPAKQARQRTKSLAPDKGKQGASAEQGESKDSEQDTPKNS